MKRLFIILSFSILLHACSSPSSSKKEKEINPFYEIAYELREQKKPDSAFRYFEMAKDLFLQRKDSLGAGKCFVNMAIIAKDKGDYFAGQEFSLRAIVYLDTTKADQFPYIESSFNNLGLAAHDLLRYREAIHFYEKAIKYNRVNDDLPVIKNNIANSYSRLGDYQRAISIYEDLLKKPLNKKYFPKILSNLAFTKWLQNPNYNAAPVLLRALQIRKQGNELLEQNASYAHLSDYYSQKSPDSSSFYALQMYNTAKKLNSANDQLQALQKLIMFSQPKASKEYFEVYRKLDDSVEIALHTSKNDFALIRYETEKTKTDLLKSQADNVQKQNDILKRNIAVVLLIVLLIFGYLLYRRRRKRLQQEKELEVKNTELKYVKKIHDRVANKVYNVMSEVENTPDMDKDHLLDKLDVIYHISRDISYERNDDHDQFASKLFTTLKSYASATVDITVSGNDEQLWIGVNDAPKSEVLCILQELMTNMKKHSRAEKVDIRFERKNNLIDITYFDDGIGMKAVSPKNGLQNTETRIQSIHGSITFDNMIEKGLKILISFPLI